MCSNSALHGHVAPGYWKSPSLRNWFTRINKVCEIEEMIHTNPDRFEAFYAIWACCL